MLMNVKYVLAVVLGLSTFAVRADAAVIYGATASGGPGNLYRLDPATGASLGLVGPLNDASGTNYPITGLAFHPITNVLYGSTANNPDETASRLVTINPNTARVTVIGNFNPGNPGTRDATMTDLAFDAAGNLYGVGSVGGPQLYSINIATGQATVIGNSGLTSTTGGGLEFTPDGTLYGTPTSSRYGTYDAGTGVYTNITNPVKPGGGGAYAAMSFGGGVLYGLNSAPGSPPPTFLAAFDPSTGNVTNLGASVQAIDAIAWVPEPGTLALLVIALISVASCRHR
jgi:hypothetical protein